MKVRRLPMVIAAVSLLTSATSLWSLDVSQGRMKLSLNEGTGRFTLSYMTDLRSSIYKPLLVFNDPRTTMICVSIGNKVYKLGESVEFALKTERTTTGGKFLWTSSMLAITEQFTFITSKGAPSADGVRMDITIKNVSAQDISVGVRIILDTYLGEASYVHFKTDKLTEVTHELTLSKSDKTAYWVSPLVGDPDQLGLMCPLTGDGVTAPDRVVFANWKRLTDASWAYETVSSRNFNIMPYSVNDSAVSQYYDAKTVKKDSESTIGLILGKLGSEGYTSGTASSASGSATADTISSLTDAARGGAGIRDTQVSVETDLSTVDRLIAYINGKLSVPDSLSAEELASLQKILEELKARGTALDASSGK